MNTNIYKACVIALSAMFLSSCETEEDFVNSGFYLVKAETKLSSDEYTYSFNGESGDVWRINRDANTTSVIQAFKEGESTPEFERSVTITDNTTFSFVQIGSKPIQTIEEAENNEQASTDPDIVKVRFVSLKEDFPTVENIRVSVLDTDGKTEKYSVEMPCDEYSDFVELNVSEKTKYRINFYDAGTNKKLSIVKLPLGIDDSDMVQTLRLTKSKSLYIF